MSISSVSSSLSSQALQHPQTIQPQVGKNRDGDEATESAAEKARESAGQAASLSTDPNRGHNVDTVA